MLPIESRSAVLGVYADAALLEYRGIMAAHIALALDDLWNGAQGPQTKPVPIEKTWLNERDPTRRRATFGVLYPLFGISIDKSNDLHAKLPAQGTSALR